MDVALSRRLAEVFTAASASLDERELLIGAAERSADADHLPDEAKVLLAALDRRAQQVAAGPGGVLAAAADSDALRIQQQWDAAKARLLKRWPKSAGPMVAELSDQAQAAVEVGDLALLGELQVSAGVVAALAVPIRKAGTDLAVEAAAGVVEEAAAQAVSITAPGAPAADRVEQHADAVARIIAAGYASGAARTALQLAGSGPAEVRAEVERHLTELGESTNGLVGTEIGGLLSAAQHAGRLAVMEQHPAREYVANENNEDRNRCDNCREANGRRYGDLRSALKDYPVNGLKSCEGRSRCRGHISPRW